MKLEGVSVRYNGKDILSGIHWTIRRGESWALVGPNGSGKSTLLSVISGDNPQAYANAVHIFGRRRGSGESVWDIKKRIGLISSELQLHFPEDQTCLETVISGFHESSGCYHRPSSEQRASARQILHRFGLLKVVRSAFRFAISRIPENGASGTSLGEIARSAAFGRALSRTRSGSPDNFSPDHRSAAPESRPQRSSTSLTGLTRFLPGFKGCLN